MERPRLRRRRVRDFDRHSSFLSILVLSIVQITGTLALFVDTSQTRYSGTHTRRYV